MASAIDHFNRAIAHASSGQLDYALVCFQEAVRLQPDFVEAHNNLGTVFLRQQKFETAIIHYRQALRYRPDYADAHSGLGAAFAAQGNWTEAVAHFQTAIRFRPAFAAAHCNLANALRSLGRLEEAVSHCREALRIQPNLPQAHDSLGSALLAQGKVEEAAARFQFALQLEPGFAAAHNNLGSCFHQQGRVDEAIFQFQHALRFQPNLADAQCNLGNAYYGQGKFELALESFQQVLRLAPNHAQAHKGRAFVWLLRGDFERGWPEFEWRWAQPGFVPRAFNQSLWDGSDLGDRTLLLYAEHGLGDTLQFVRYANAVSRKLMTGNARIIVECQPQLLPLLSTATGIDRLVGRGDALPCFDAHAPLLSMPRILGTTLENIPNNVPHLHADPDMLKHWRNDLQEVRLVNPETCTPHFLLGVSWQGDPTYYHDRARSIPLSRFAPLAQVPGVRLISLQKGPGTEQLRIDRRQSEFPLQSAIGNRQSAILTPVLDEGAGAFMDTAALMQSLDLVISSDTAICHLAGALGVPIWVALPFVPDWRWLLDREDCPWYPSMRLFRQSRQGCWEDVFQRIAEELKIVVLAAAS
jgi:tetratricopeptide (TPR) repeat protein